MRFRRTKVFEDILYAQCWEDPQIDRRAFRITPDDTVFSITSGGCNVLTFLLDNPRIIIALDINPYQNRLLELKMAAFQRLTYEQILEFLGIRECSSRANLYATVRASLPPESRQYWDAHASKIAAGIINSGRYEHYMHLIRKCLTAIMGRSLIQKFFELEDPGERARLYHSRWENIRWNIITRFLLSRRMMSILFDKAFFTYVDGNFSFGKHFASKVERAFTELPFKANYFLSYILLGRFYSEAFLPPYLMRENFETIRSRLGRITVVTGSCESFFEDVPESSIAKFNFTNIFEWMSEAEFVRLLEETWRVAQDGAIITYRNLLVHRERPSVLGELIHPLREMAEDLHRHDLSFIYENYVVEQVTKHGWPWNTVSTKSAVAVR